MMYILGKGYDIFFIHIGLVFYILTYQFVQGVN